MFSDDRGLDALRVSIRRNDETLIKRIIQSKRKPIRVKYLNVFLDETAKMGYPPNIFNEECIEGLFCHQANLNLGRTEMFTESDLAIAHKYRFGRDNRVTFEPYI